VRDLLVGGGGPAPLGQHRHRDTRLGDPTGEPDTAIGPPPASTAPVASRSVHNRIIENHAIWHADLVRGGHVLTSDDSEVLSHLIGDRRWCADLLAEASGVRCASCVDPSPSPASTRGARPDRRARGSRRSSSVSRAALIPRVGHPPCRRPRRPLRPQRTTSSRVANPAPCGSPTSTAPTSGPRRSIDHGLAAGGRRRYDDFMTKEIHEQPKAVAATLRGRRAPDGTLVLDESAGLSHDDLRSIERV